MFLSYQMQENCFLICKNINTEIMKIATFFVPGFSPNNAIEIVRIRRRSATGKALQ